MGAYQWNVRAREYACVLLEYHQLAAIPYAANELSLGGWAILVARLERGVPTASTARTAATSPSPDSAADTSAAFDAARAAGVELVEAAWSMWHPRMRRVTDLVSSGEMGAIRNFLGTFTFDGVPEGNYRLNPQMGGGALLDIGIYPLHALIGCAPTWTPHDIEKDAIDGGLGVDMTTKARLTTKTCLLYTSPSPRD